MWERCTRRSFVWSRASAEGRTDLITGEGGRRCVQRVTGGGGVGCVQRATRLLPFALLTVTMGRDVCHWGTCCGSMRRLCNTRVLEDLVAAK